MKNRLEIEEQYKWDLSGYYKTDEDWENDYNYVKNNYKKVLEYENRLNTKTIIHEYFVFDIKLSKITEKLAVYSSLRLQEDLSNTESQKRQNKLEKLFTDMSVCNSFVNVELSNLSDDFLNELICDNEFCNYDLIIKDIIKNKKHMLSVKEEKLLAGIGDFSGQFSDIFDMFDSIDVKFDDIKDSNGNLHEMSNSAYYKYIYSPDRELRKNASISLTNAYKKMNNVLASNYIGHIKSDCFYSNIRKFDSSLSASIYAEDSSENVYNSLINNVNRYINQFQKYFSIKKKILKLDDFATYDINANVGGLENKYTYSQAFEIITHALNCLGDDYVNILKTAKKDRWIDVYPNEGKCTGAFSSGAYRCNPVILTNFEGTTNCVFTLAHELGHSMHTYYSNLYQPFEKSNYEIFVAEVASTVNEILLLKYFLKNSKTKQEKDYYYNYLFNMINGTIFVQTKFAEFEQKAHSQYENGEQLTANYLNNCFDELNKKYYGKDVKILEGTECSWSRIPHFYNSFYVYKYATGFISAFFIANKIFDNDKNTIDNYKRFLSMGGTLPPVELLKVAGVDLTNENTFDYAFKQMLEILDEWEKTINF